MMHIVLLGAPGAGKGTQAALVAKALKLAHLATGDLFREVQEKDTELARLVRSYMESGKLVPDEITIRMVSERLAAPESRSGVIFDGFPRNVKQAEALDKALAEMGKTVDKAVYIKVSERELLSRLGGRWVCRKCQAPYHEVTAPPEVKGKCDRCGGELYQRADDTPGTVKRRLDVYFAETAPLIDYYQRSGKLLEVNGEGDIGSVEWRIVAAIGGTLTRPA
ncbi:MAG: adenylate kinase [Chloroflexi bacterium]|nr:adenylate kinase [Chloroflexota bacterium]